MSTLLSAHWIPQHRGSEDAATFARWKPPFVKIVTDSEQVPYLEDVPPDAKIIIRHYRMSDPERRVLDSNTHAQHLGGEHAQQCRRMATYCDSKGIAVDRLLFEGLNEPQLWAGESPELVGVYYESFLYWLHEHELHGVVGNFGVGWPGNGGVADAPVQWDFFKPAIDQMAAGDYLGLHEYWALAGPAENWRWWAGRYLQCPFDVPIIITECGIDLGVANQPYGGWQDLPGNEEQRAKAYVDHLRWYEGKLRKDGRIQGACVFTYDYGSNHWERMNIRNNTFLAALWPYLDSLGPIVQPEQPAPAPVVAIAYPLPPGKGRLTQVFGVNAAAYAKFGLRGHNGIDWGVDVGTAVLAAAAGVVREAQYDADGFGNYVKLIHPWGETLYAHLSHIGVKVGATVGVGDQIGLTGNTGNSTGPHLHFGVRVNPYDRADGWQGYSDPARWLATATPAVDTGAIVDAAWRAIGIPRNTDAALYKAAQAAKLGRPVTAEFDWQGFRAQGYDGGIVYCAIGDWGNVKTVVW